MKQKTCLGLVLVAMAGIGVLALHGHSQTRDAAPNPGDKKESTPTTTQVLMKDKLTFANKALDGLAVEDFGKIAESAKMMRMISRAASWYVLDSEEYTHISKNFQEQAADLERHAKEKNLDAAALDYMRISLTCVQCHKYMRQVRKKEKP
jgi:hypothetical protein